MLVFKTILPWMSGCLRSATLPASTAQKCYTWSARLMSTARPVKRKTRKSEKQQARKFVDFRQVRVTGGKGGDGCLSFLSLPCNEWAGPDGGDGGNGGHIIFQASSGMKSLEHLSSLLSAESGVKGRSKHCHGKNAAHCYTEVPLGTLFKDSEGKSLADLQKEGEYFVAARGGAGGKGNHFFLSNENRAPAAYEEGAVGEERLLFVELRVMAHAGLVGFPNAGKSTLLRAISRAKPKVAAYPFTTLNPHVGMVQYDDHEQVAVADIPGLIKGAHLNHGLGFAFLRHIERCLCLLYVIDLSVEEPWTQFYDLQYELEQYQEGLSKRPHAIIGNKIDLPLAEQNLKLLKDEVNLPVFGISAKHNEHIEPLLLHVRELYDNHVPCK